MDEPLLRSARKGDSRAFQQLYEQHAPVVFRLAFRLLGNRLDAEDITQEVSYKEIATIMACSLGTVASRLARARQQVAHHLRRTGIDATYLG